LIYSSSTANAIYKAVATQVEHIFFDGEPYHVEQYAYNINVRHVLDGIKPEWPGCPRRVM
jgi:hypothetical protein